MRGLIRAFQQSGLPLEVLEHKNMPIPLSLMSALFESSARVLGERSLGLSVGKAMSYQVYEEWSNYAAQAGFLGNALRRACATVGSQLSETTMTLSLEQDRWMWRVTPPIVGHSSMQYADHIIFPMLAFAQIYLGVDWRPTFIEVCYPRDEATSMIERALKTNLRCNGPGIAIPFSYEEIAVSHPAADAIALKPLTLREVTGDVALSEAPEPARSFSAVVALRLLAGQTDIDGAAEIAGFGVQGLQRRLRVAGYTYREIVEMARRDRAMALLTQADLSIAQIAFALGYEEHANFSRAFQRWMGCSPSTYRNGMQRTPV